MNELKKHIAPGHNESWNRSPKCNQHNTDSSLLHSINHVELISGAVVAVSILDRNAECECSSCCGLGFVCFWCFWLEVHAKLSKYFLIFLFLAKQSQIPAQNSPTSSTRVISSGYQEISDNCTTTVFSDGIVYHWQWIHLTPWAMRIMTKFKNTLNFLLKRRKDC